MARELGLVRIALGRVSVYEGITDVSPTVMMVDDLVRNYAELEARIDAAMMVLTGLKGLQEARGDFLLYNDLTDALDSVYGLLRGGTRVPDDPSALDGD
jgi:hypothetical protein